MSTSRPALAILVLAALAGCGGQDGATGPGGGSTSSADLACPGATPLTLAPGQHAVVDPATARGCLALPDPGAPGAEYLLAVVSAAGQAIQGGRAGPFYLQTGPPGSRPAAVSAGPSASIGTARPPSPEQVLHDWLRTRERELAAEPRALAGPPAAPGAGVPPAVGDQRTFKVCGGIPCDHFVDVVATARSVGEHAAIYLDQNAPTADSLQQSDLDLLRDTFDRYHYPIDVGAYGGESDVDGNGRVVILLTKAVNDLTPDCTNGRVLGYFYGLDLLPGQPNSNAGEVFYAFVPAPGTTQCAAISRATAAAVLQPTLIHEFQHMISFNQHVLRRAGQTEVTWLNEGMSHFAEELGGREIPEAQCPGYSSCRSQYISGNLFNAYDYLEHPDSYFLVYPTESTGTLPERGASWLFVRWLADQFSSDALAGDLTRTVDGTQLLGFRWGNYDGQFEIAHDLAVGPDGSVYVGDATGKRIQKLVPTTP